MPEPKLPAFSAIYSFGDSLSDAGNLSISTTLTGTIPVSPPYFEESYGLVSGNVFCNGPTWVQNISLTLGLGKLAPSLTGGTDFAYGGAETGSTPQNAGSLDISAISLPAQLTEFETFGADPTASMLFTLSIGSNDLLDILADPSLTPQQRSTDVTDSVNNEISFINSLASDGVKHLLVMDVPDLGKTPEVQDGLADGSNTPSAALDSLASQLASDYNTDLSGQLATVARTDTIDVNVVDAYGLIDNAVAHPAAYGLTNVTSPVWSGDYTDAGSGTLAVTGMAAQDKYLFFDHLHPTEAGAQQLADLAETELAPACFAAGTRIATARGEVPVQQLRIGDLLSVAGGGTAPVTWLGHRRVDCRRHRRPHDVLPVRIAAHAFAPGRPRNDLLLSPDHAVFVDGNLIPARYLLNGATVRQEDVAAVTYWHVELPAHGVLFAEGLPAESYLDTGNRGAFANGGAVVRMHADFARTVWAASGCAPLLLGGAELQAVRRTLRERAATLGHVSTRDPALCLLVDGRELKPTITGRSHRFRLPAAARHGRIASRSEAPAHMHDDSTDHRRLGVAVCRIALDGEPIALTDPRLRSGWHEVEAGGGGAPDWRWTDGDAALELAGARELEIAIAITGCYWLPRPLAEVSATCGCA